MVVGETAEEVDLVVLGAGPGGYTAALRAAELGVGVTLVDGGPIPGGVCLREGCIPSKALLHAAEVINTSAAADAYGIHFEKPRINLDQLRNWKLDVTEKLGSGITSLCKAHNVEIIYGQARFIDSRNIRIDRHDETAISLKFKQAIVATGSRPVELSKLYKSASQTSSGRIGNSTDFLMINDIPERLLVVGGGYIGLELGTVYATLGSAVTVIEMTDGLLPGCDRDLVKPLAKSLENMFSAIYLNSKVISLADLGDLVKVEMEGAAPAQASFDRVLVAVGRRPNSDNIGLENTNVEIDNYGFLKIDSSCRTNDARIFAIGDVSGQPMLAHRAMRQGRVAAEALAGLASSFDNRAIPAVIFTEPEIAWCGLTEGEAKSQGVEIKVAKFPWSASGRALTLGHRQGQTKIIFDPKTTQVLGVGIAGAYAGELINECVLAIEMGAMLDDIASAIHAHPTLSETIAEAAFAALNRQNRGR